MKQTGDIKYPVGIQSFEKLIEGGYIYVDKTAIIPLLKTGKYYFLSRPRRFGKSLLLSTLEAYYQGKRGLFKGLALDTLTDEWDPHPVLHLDLNNREYADEYSLIAEFNANLERWEELYGDEKRDRAPEERFAYVIRSAYEKTGKKVVILVDEYDKPLLNTIHRPELADIYRSQLKAFYSNLKTMDPCIEMAMLTGVARFSKVSIFSDLNNLRDISFDDEFASICGITSDELDKYFQAGIRSLAEKKRTTSEAIREELRKRYDGYHFSQESPDIYNPFTLINVFASKRMGDYWFSSGTPTYLVRLIERGAFPFRDIAPVSIESRTLESAGLLSTNPVPAFYQSGYLTIKGFDEQYEEYILDYPNEEVKRGFLYSLMESYMPLSESPRGFSIVDFAKDANEGRPESFMRRMDSLIASVPYSEKGSAESHFQNAVYLLFTLLGYYTRMEDRTSDGRIDLQVETPRYVYIFEFKVDSSSEKAVAQIHEKKYWLREGMSGKKIYLIGANFDTSTRRMTDPIIEEVD